MRSKFIKLHYRNCAFQIVRGTSDTELQLRHIHRTIFNFRKLFQPRHKPMSKDNEHDKVTAAYLVPLTEKGIEKFIRGKKKEQIWNHTLHT